jgi:hypothetical protein
LTILWLELQYRQLGSTELVDLEQANDDFVGFLVEISGFGSTLALEDSSAVRC